MWFCFEDFFIKNIMVRSKFSLDAWINRYNFFIFRFPALLSTYAYMYGFFFVSW